MTGRQERGIRVSPALALLALTPLLLATKCFEYQPPAISDTSPVDSGMDAPVETGVPDSAVDTGGVDTSVPIDTGVPPMLSPEGMIAEACLAFRCSAADAVRYWRDDWDDNHVERVVTFRDPDAATARFDVTDVMGAPADLRFDAAMPVTVHIVAPGDGSATAAHDFTAPAFFRSLALRDVSTDAGSYDAPAIDAVLPRFEAGVEHRATIRFVPIESGSYPLFSSTGVTDGTRYAEILEGTVTPDLGTGDAGKGMSLTIDVAGDAELSVFQGQSPDRPPALDADPRRDADDAIWDGGAAVLIGIVAEEGRDAMTGETIFSFDWTTRTLTADVGHVLELTNTPGNRFRHDFTALGMMSDSVVRGALDPEAEVRAPYFSGTSISPGATIQLFVVPTIARDYQTYCQIGVSHADNGAPDLSTGHAGSGMQDLISVVP